MKRRNLMKAGAVSAMLPLAGCGSDTAPQGDTKLTPVNPSGTNATIDMPKVDFPAPGAEPASFDFPLVTALPFAHGVASGDPLADRVIIWTRVTLLPGTNVAEVPVNWRVASDPEMKGVVRSGVQSTSAGRDWTVKVDVTGLSPASTYYYQFETFQARSIVGRTRTAPSSAVAQIRMAVLSCSSYWSSTWSGYGHIAKRNDLDLVVHCGDYIYDFVDEDEEIRARKNKRDITYVDYRDWVNLEELRRRYALYRSDKNLMRAHQQHPWFIVWDNHDIDTGYGNELPGPERKSSLTVAETTQVFWEWTPSRPVKADGSGEFLLYENGEYPAPVNPLLVYRTLPLGPMAQIMGVDTQIFLERYGQKADASHLPTDTPSLLGRKQFDWLLKQLSDAQTRGVQWKLINNQTWIAPWAVPNIAGSPVMNLPVRWSDYVGERARLIDELRSRKINGTVFLSGDMHGNWAADIIKETEAAVASAYQSGPPILSNLPGAQSENPTAGWRRAATGNLPGQNNRALSCAIEFAPSSMGRGGADELVANATPGSPVQAQVAGSRAVEQATLLGNRHVQFMEWVEHGYGIVHLQADRAVFECWWQDKRVADSPDVLGAQLISWATEDANAVPTPKFLNQIDDIRSFGLNVSATSGTRTSVPAPEAFTLLER